MHQGNLKGLAPDLRRPDGCPDAWLQPDSGTERATRRSATRLKPGTRPGGENSRMPVGKKRGGRIELAVALPPDEPVEQGGPGPGSRVRDSQKWSN